VSWLDGDDLWSENWLVESYAVFSQDSTVSIVHPEHSIYFDDSINRVVRHPTMKQRFEYTDTLYFRNLWTSLCMARTQVYSKVSYIKNSISDGFGYEDWCWNMDTVRYGMIHRTAAGTMHAIRQRKNSLSENTARLEAIPRLVRMYNKKRADPDSVVNEVCCESPKIETALNTITSQSNIFSDLPAKLSSGFGSLLRNIAVGNDAVFENSGSPVKTSFCEFSREYNAFDTVLCLENCSSVSLQRLQTNYSLDSSSERVLVVVAGKADTNADFSCIEEYSWKLLVLGEYCREFHRAHWYKVLHIIVGEITPKLIVNFDSDVGSEMYKRYAHQLSQYCLLLSDSIKKECELESNTGQLRRIRVSLDRSIEMVSSGDEGDVSRAAAVEWSCYPRPDGWMKNDLTIRAERGVSCFITVFLPKSELSENKILRVSGTGAGVCRQIVLVRGRRTRIELFSADLFSTGPLSTDPLSTDPLSVKDNSSSEIRLQCAPEPVHNGNGQKNLGFVLLNEDIEVPECPAQSVV